MFGSNDEPKIEHTILELGHIRVFSFETSSSIMKNYPPTNVYWHFIGAAHAFGPFPGLHDALAHYTSTIANQKKEQDESAGKEKIIYVNFRSKKRVGG